MSYRQPRKGEQQVPSGVSRQSVTHDSESVSSARARFVTTRGQFRLRRGAHLQGLVTLETIGPLAFFARH